MTPVLSVVIPMYNEEDALDPLVNRLRPVLDSLGVSYEVLPVDDGSTDATARELTALAEQWAQVRIVRLRRNAGHQAALSAGVRCSLGAYVVSLDADLQDPPEKIPEMLELARNEKLDVVYGVRSDRGRDSFFKRNTAGAYYALMHRMIGPWVPRQAGDFRLISRAVVDTLLTLPEHQPVYRLLVPSLGFPSGTVHYVRSERVAGNTKYPLSRMVRLAWDSVTNFSAAPLRLATWLGVASFAFCLLMIVFAVVVYVGGSTVPGWASLFITVLFLGGLQLICLGLLGEYVGRIYATVQNRPTYHIAVDEMPDRASRTRAALVDLDGPVPAKRP